MKFDKSMDRLLPKFSSYASHVFRNGKWFGGHAEYRLADEMDNKQDNEQYILHETMAVEALARFTYIPIYVRS